MMPNANQTESLVRTVLKIVGAALIAHGYTTSAALINAPEALGIVLAAIGVIGSLIHHASDTTPPASTSGKNSALVVLLAVAMLAVFGTGCTSIVNTPGGKIVSVTERGLGFHAKMTSTTTQTPDFVFGFWSSAVVIIPTSTNSPTYSPNFANTFDFGQTGLMQLGIGENIASGSYQTLTPNSTNSSVATQPIVAK